MKMDETMKSADNLSRSFQLTAILITAVTGRSQTVNNCGEWTHLIAKPSSHHKSRLMQN